MIYLNSTTNLGGQSFQTIFLCLSKEKLNSIQTKLNDFSGKLAWELNEEQKTAAINIANTRNSPLPYLIFGPAGELSP